MTLAELNPGDTAVIKTFKTIEAAKNIGAAIRRMMTLGINPGASVKMVRRAPLGDPLEFEVSGCLLTLRSEDAGCVLIHEASCAAEAVNG